MRRRRRGGRENQCGVAVSRHPNETPASGVVFARGAKVCTDIHIATQTTGVGSRWCARFLAVVRVRACARVYVRACASSSTAMWTTRA